ncbi:MAG: helix-turn-helix domain-containing protein [Ferruginibacter sp.]
MIENNTAAQKRISDAANHFEPKFLAYQKTLQNHPLLTEHKETANIINEQLQQLALAIYSTVYYLQYCKTPFSVTTFLQHKLKFAQPKINLTCYASGKKENYSDVANPELFDTLKRWRDMMVQEENVAIYMVANGTTLREIATYLPLTKKDLLQITGFGKAKVDKYGDDILETVESYCSRHGVETNMKALPTKAAKEKAQREKNAVSKTDTKTLSFNLYKEGKSIAEIAAERNLSIGTIETHLIAFIVSGEIEIGDLVPQQKQSLILDAVAKHGSSSLNKLIENLPKDISYNDIRMVFAAEKINANTSN